MKDDQRKGGDWDSVFHFNNHIHSSTSLTTHPNKQGQRREKEKAQRLMSMFAKQTSRKTVGGSARVTLTLDSIPKNAAPILNPTPADVILLPPPPKPSPSLVSAPTPALLPPPLAPNLRSNFASPSPPLEPLNPFSATTDAETIRRTMEDFFDRQSKHFASQNALYSSLCLGSSFSSCSNQDASLRYGIPSGPGASDLDLFVGFSKERSGKTKALDHKTKRSRLFAGPKTGHREREMRVFISSTFRDMDREREVLIKKVMPELRAMCEERRVAFAQVDLRWGITAEQSLEGDTPR